MRTVSIVIPVYFNQDSLPLLFDELLNVESQLAARACALELIFVDDGSGDGSLEALLGLRQRRPGTKIVKLARNFGAVHSSKIGLKFVTGDCFLWLAADLQDPPALVTEMVDHWLAGAKYVLAARAARRDPALTLWFAAIYYRLVRLVVMPDYPRGGFDMLLLDKSLIPYIRDSGRHANTSLLAHWLGFKPVILTYERPKRPRGQSRWTFARKLSYFIDSILGFSALPLRLIALVGMVVSLAGFGCGGYMLVSALVGTGATPTLPLLVALFSFLLGLIIVLLGIIGEYVWRIFDEVSRRPEVVIDEVYQ